MTGPAGWVALSLIAAALLFPTFARAEVNASRATSISSRDPNVAKERAENGSLTHSANEVDGNWEVAWFADGKEVALVVVDPATGAVRESWTGYQVAWKMARGYPGAFGHKLNAPYVFLPLCAVFLLGLVDWRRLRRIANLDLLFLLGFGVSHWFFNRAEVGVSVPLQYVPLVYLFARALWIGSRGTERTIDPSIEGSIVQPSAREGLSPAWPTSWLLVAALFLVGFRVGLNMADSGVIDVGYASEVGASRIVHGEPIYGNFPEDVSQGDTYGPVAYLAYAPFERIWPWSGTWNDLPAAHAAAVFFDLATFALLLLLGRRIRPGPAGNKLSATLAFAWAAYPYTAFALLSNSNDTLVALLLVGTLWVLARPVARGTLSALASLTKFAPLVLVPMLATYTASPAGGMGQGGRGQPVDCPQAPLPHDRTRGLVAFAVAFVLTALALLIWPAIDPGPSTVWDRTIAYQAGRDSPFSIWGQVAWLEPLRIALLAAVATLAIAFAFRPKEKKLSQVAVLGAALLIGVQLTLHHWFYLYIVWFYPLLLVGIAVGSASSGHSSAAPAARPEEALPTA
jgi:hypothetical protein